MKILYIITVILFSTSCISSQKTVDPLKLQKIEKKDIMVFVVHKDNDIESLTKAKLTSLYLAKEQYWSDGSIPIKCIDLPQDTRERRALYKTIMRKDRSSIDRYWIKSVERGYPRRKPIIIGTSERILNMIHRDSHTIGYLNLADYEEIRERKHLKLKTIAIEDIEPSVDNARKGKYSFVSIEN